MDNVTGNCTSTKTNITVKAVFDGNQSGQQAFMKLIRRKYRTSGADAPNSQAWENHLGFAVLRRGWTMRLETGNVSCGTGSGLLPVPWKTSAFVSGGWWMTVPFPFARGSLCIMTSRGWMTGKQQNIFIRYRFYRGFLHTMANGAVSWQPPAGSESAFLNEYWTCSL